MKKLYILVATIVTACNAMMVAGPCGEKDGRRKKVQRAEENKYLVKEKEEKNRRSKEKNNTCSIEKCTKPRIGLSSQDEKSLQKIKELTETVAALRELTKTYQGINKPYYKPYDTNQAKADINWWKRDRLLKRFDKECPVSIFDKWIAIKYQQNNCRDLTRQLDHIEEELGFRGFETSNATQQKARNFWR